MAGKKRSQTEHAADAAAKARAIENAAGQAVKPSAAPSDAMDVDHDVEMGEFEDPFEDEYEEDEEVVDGDDENMDYVDEDEDEAADDNVRVYLPGQPLAEGEELEVDNSAYEMLHRLNVKWPCLSFDILRDQLGLERTKFPHTTYLVAGSQADQADKNELFIMKMSQLCKTKYDDDEDSGNESDDDIEEDPILEHRSVRVRGGINRVRVMPSANPATQIVAAWNEMGHVDVYDLSQHVRALDTPGVVVSADHAPLHKISHKDEGFAMDWSSKVEGQLLTGDCSKMIKLSVASPTGFNTTMAFAAHKKSVEDLQWSPSEATVFASSSADGTVKIFDTRMGSKPGISATVADCDVNVISWNRLTPFLLASGHDDGSFAVWDLREFARASNKANVRCAPAAQFAWHRAPVTSIEWHTHEESMLAVAGDDNQVTLWDLSTEKDDAADAKDLDGQAVPPQLLFIHMGQEYVKEVHWHQQIPGCLVTTAASGFNVFKTINS
ncbi:ribosome biosynthesis protein rrb1 [Allomyces javanicus]|nr:ribosome biosynthesis protein rrb1 [Allomyces javanicus]